VKGYARIRIAYFLIQEGAVMSLYGIMNMEWKMINKTKVEEYYLLGFDAV
jgi:hypothetical protein